jgi:hypothetical protein
MCYGRLHPDGRRLPADAFGRDPERVNGLTELCLQCQPHMEESKVTTRKCTGCGTEKNESEFYSKSHGKCKVCTLARQKELKAQRAGKGSPVSKRAQAEQAKAKPSAPVSDAELILGVLLACGKINQSHIDAARELIND